MFHEDRKQIHNCNMLSIFVGTGIVQNMWTGPKIGPKIGLKNIQFS